MLFDNVPREELNPGETHLVVCQVPGSSTERWCSLPRLHILGDACPARGEGQLRGTSGKPVVPVDTACLLLLSATTEGSLQQSVTSTRWQIQLKDVSSASYFPVSFQWGWGGRGRGIQKSSDGIIFSYLQKLQKVDPLDYFPSFIWVYCPVAVAVVGSGICLLPSANRAGEKCSSSISYPLESPWAGRWVCLLVFPNG